MLGKKKADEGGTNPVITKKRKKSRLRFILCCVFLAAVILLGGIIYIPPLLSNAFARTWIVEYDSIRITEDVHAYFVRTEELFTANDTGDIQYFFEEGTLIRKGTKVLEVALGNHTYIAGNNGTVSYYSDGLETFFTPERMNDFDANVLAETVIEVTDTKRQSAVPGEVLYKIVDTAEWYVTFFVKPEHITRYEQGKIVTLELPKGGVRGVVESVLEKGDMFQIILRFTRYYEDLCILREVDTQVTTQDYEGLLVRMGSITTQDGVPGVYVKNISGQFEFTPVSIVISDGEYAILASNSFTQIDAEGNNVKVDTVKAYDEILNNPREAE